MFLHGTSETKIDNTGKISFIWHYSLKNNIRNYSSKLKTIYIEIAYCKIKKYLLCYNNIY